MIILDTNIVSELGKARANQNVVDWITRKDITTLHLCSVVLMEQIYGAEKTSLKTGSDRFYRAIDNLKDTFRDRVVEWSSAAAEITGKLRARREAIGCPISTHDAMIAAICLHHGATLATRNTKDFEGLDLKLVNPFEER